MVQLFSPRFPTQPSPGGTQIATTAFPTELAPFVKDILEKAKAQQVGAAYQPYTAPQLAPFTEAEKAAMSGIQAQTTGLAGTDVAQAQPYFAGAKTAVEGLGQQFTGDVAQQYMNPYQQAVTDQAKKKAIEDYERVTVPQLAAQAIAQQPFGGSRQAITEGLAREGLADRLSEMQEKGLASAYAQGQKAFELQKNRELQQAQQLTALGQTIPNQALRDLAIQQQLGEQERQMQQQALDLDKAQFLEEREFPTRALQEYSALVRGFPFQPSTYTASTEYQATPSLAQQLLGLGAAGMGAYTQFTGKPMAEMFKGATGGGIADIIHNQMGTNQQMFMTNFLKHRFQENARGWDVDNDGKRKGRLNIEEFYNRYGIGGTERNAVEDIIDEQILPGETAPFRVEEDMTESAQGAPAGGPLPSREEMEELTRKRLMEELKMRRLMKRRNEGGLVSLPYISNATGDNNQDEIDNQGVVDNINRNVVPIAEEIIKLEPETTQVFSPTDAGSGANIYTNNIDTNIIPSSVEDMEEMYKKIGPLIDKKYPKESKELMESVEERTAKETPESIKRLTDVNSALMQATKKRKDFLSNIADPESPERVEAEKRARVAQAGQEAQGWFKAAQAFTDPSKTIVQGIAESLGHVGTGVGAGNEIIDNFIKEDIQTELGALSGIEESEVNIQNLLTNAEQISNQFEAQKINSALTQIGQTLDYKVANDQNTITALGHWLQTSIAKVDAQIKAETNEISKQQLNVERAKLLNQAKYWNASYALEKYKTDVLKNTNLATIFNDSAKIISDAKTAMIDTLKFTADETKNIQATIDKIFEVSYVDGQPQIKGQLMSPAMVRAYGYAHAEAMRLGSINKSRGLNAAQNIGPLIHKIRNNHRYAAPIDILIHLSDDAKQLYKIDKKNAATKTMNEIAGEILRAPPDELKNKPEVLAQLKATYGIE